MMLLLYLLLYFLIGTTLLCGFFFLCAGSAIGSSLGMAESLTMFVPAALLIWLLRRIGR